MLRRLSHLDLQSFKLVLTSWARWTFHWFIWIKANVVPCLAKRTVKIFLILISLSTTSGSSKPEKYQSIWKSMEISTERQQRKSQCSHFALHPSSDAEFAWCRRLMPGPDTLHSVRYVFKLAKVHIPFRDVFDRPCMQGSVWRVLLWQPSYLHSSYWSDCRCRLPLR